MDTFLTVSAVIIFTAVFLALLGMLAYVITTPKIEHYCNILDNDRRSRARENELRRKAETILPRLIKSLTSATSTVKMYLESPDMPSDVRNERSQFIKHENTMLLAMVLSGVQALIPSDRSPRYTYLEESWRPCFLGFDLDCAVAQLAAEDRERLNPLLEEYKCMCLLFKYGERHSGAEADVLLLWHRLNQYRARQTNTVASDDRVPLSAWFRVELEHYRPTVGGVAQQKVA
ncbi:MAG TPA: hypothetical protein V6C81_29200 [Planktothrix sp.]|jgi:hypothetical protein